MTPPRLTVAFQLNGARATATCEAATTALDLLRAEFALTGTREGCGVGECGACTILIDGAPVLGCLLLAAELDGRRVTTIESNTDERVERMREAFIVESAFQCGFCTPGMILAASRIPAGATDARIRQALAGHACRCTGYASIVRAVQRAHRRRADNA
jgi:aerobic-type carbon monoxide dehydrogenase small subunit (CoxS/CutS family)